MACTDILQHTGTEVGGDWVMHALSMLPINLSIKGKELRHVRRHDSSSEGTLRYPAAPASMIAVLIVILHGVWQHTRTHMYLKKRARFLLAATGGCAGKWCVMSGDSAAAARSPDITHHLPARFVHHAPARANVQDICTLCLEDAAFLA